MRRLPRSAQRALIGMDLRRHGNPSAYLWIQIQKLREESSHDEGRPRSPQPVSVFAKQPPPPNPPTVPTPPPPPMLVSKPGSAAGVSNGPAYPAQAKLKEQSPEPPAGPGHKHGSVAFVLFRHSGGASVPEFVEVFDHEHVLTCGRASSSDVLLKVQHASKKHAEFRVEHGPSGEALLMFCDLSSNGTWLNGDKLPSSRLTRLLSGDILFFMPPGSSNDVPAMQVEQTQSEAGRSLSSEPPMLESVPCPCRTSPRPWPSGPSWPSAMAGMGPRKLVHRPLARSFVACKRRFRLPLKS